MNDSSKIVHKSTICLRLATSFTGSLRELKGISIMLLAETKIEWYLQRFRFSESVKNNNAKCLELKENRDFKIKAVFMSVK